MITLHKIGSASSARLSVFWYALAVLGLAPATQVLGSEQRQSQAAPATETAALEEITVTADRVQENLQIVPVTVSAATAVELQESGVTDIQSLSALVPSVVNTGTVSNYTYVRGIGSSNASLNNEAAVASYVDGVYMASPYGQFGAFNNIDRIEVLKGPQGTLFGRNTTGGVIQTITLDPRQESSFNFQETYASYNTLGGKAYMTGGLSDHLAADLAIVYENQQRGWGTDLCPDLVGTTCSPATPTGFHQNTSLRSKVMWTPSGATKVVGEADYALYKSNLPLQMAPGSIDSFDHVTTYPGRYNGYGIPYIMSAQQYGQSLHIDHDLDSGLHFVSITSNRKLDGYEIHDNTRTPNNALYTITEWSSGTYQTQELQLMDKRPGRFTWLLGGYYFGDVVGYNPRTQTGTSVNSARFLNIFSNQTVRSYSGYAQGTIEVFDKTKLDLSARYTDESLVLNGQYQNAAGQVVTSANSTTGAVVYNQTLKATPWTYRAALNRQFTPDVMGYISFTHGFKSGGFNLPTPQRNPFLPERINSYEVGVKTESVDHSVRLNVSGFYYKYQDIQVVIVPGLSGQLFTNAGAADAKGIDAEFEFAVTPRFTFHAALGYLDAKYTDFPNAQSFTSAGVAVAIPNAAGYQLPYAPKWSGNIGLNYTKSTTIGDFTMTPNLAYSAAYPFTTDTNFIIDRSYMVNAQVEWKPPTASAFSVQLWGKNLANEYRYAGGTESSGGWYATPTAPRTYGITFLQKF